jgi:uncharacterized protein (TIGR03000 family)
MCKRIFSAIALSAAAVGLFSAASDTAVAQRPTSPNALPQSFYNSNPGYYGPYYPGQYRYGGVNPGIYNNSSTGYGTSSSVPMPYSAQAYGSSPSVYVPPSYGYRIAAPTPPISIRPVRDDTVQASVRLPTAAAELWVEGQKTISTGTWRRFSSPPLVPGERYIYEFRARWFDNGRELVQSRKVPVRAGERIIVDFTTPARSPS